MYELAIIGGGPAGSAASVYAARKQLKTLLITESFGGQSTDSGDIQNWLGMPHVPGIELAKLFETHVRAYAGGVVDILENVRAEHIEKSADGFRITAGGQTFDTKTILLATGGKRRMLDVPGAKEFEHKGLTYCASCDGPVFSGQDVAVVGGGNAGFESAAQLLAYTKSVTLIHRQPDFSRADAATVASVMAHPNFRAITNAVPVEVIGQNFVTGIAIEHKDTGARETLPVAGIFVEIGMNPATELVHDLVERDQSGKITIDHKTQRTSCTGIWAAGDCTDGLYHQNNIAAGDAVKALENIYYFIRAGA